MARMIRATRGGRFNCPGLCLIRSPAMPQVHALVEAGNVVKEGWNGYNVLHDAASRVAALDLGFLPSAQVRRLHDIGPEPEPVLDFGLCGLGRSAINPKMPLVAGGRTDRCPLGPGVARSGVTPYTLYILCCYTPHPIPYTPLTTGVHSQRSGARHWRCAGLSRCMWHL